MNRTNHSDIKSEVVELFDLSEAYKKAKKDYEEYKAKVELDIKNYMYVNNTNDLEILADEKKDRYLNPFILQIKKVTKTTITYFADKIEEKLGKEVTAAVVDKSYTINNWDGFVKVLKKYKVNPKEVKKLINVNEVVNKNKLNELYELGEFKFEDLEGCYNSSESSYLKIERLNKK